MSGRTVSFSATTPEEDRRQLIRTTLNREGGDPSMLLQLLCDIVEFRDWERFGVSLKKYIETSYDQGGMGWSVNDVETVLNLTHRSELRTAEVAERMATMRTTIRDELRGVLKKSSGRPPNNDDISSFPRKKLGSTGRDYWIAKLEGEGRFDVADKLRADPKFTVKMAKEAIGIKITNRLTISADNAVLAAEVILKNMEPEVISDLAEILLESIVEIPTDDPHAAAEIFIERMSPDALAELVTLLTEKLEQVQEE